MVSLTSSIRARLGVVALILTIVAGCAGPREPLNAGVKTFPSDVILGSQGEDEPEQVALPPTFVAPDALPTPPIVLSSLPPVAPGLPAPRPADPPPPCPEADPFAAPRLEAPNSVLGPPAEGEYTSRNTGVVEVSGPNARKEPVVPKTTRVVRKVVVAADGSFTHEVVSILGFTGTLTTYRTVPVKAGGGSGGIFITSITTATGAGEPQTFRPTPALEILRFPIEVGSKWNAVATDADARTTLAYAATTQVKRRVDACGTVLDGQVVRIDGNFAPCAEFNPPAPPPAAPVTKAPPVKECAPPQPGASFDDNGQSSFVATYVFGTQYGGITLLEDTVADSTEGGVGAHRELLSIINVEPPPAKVKP